MGFYIYSPCHGVDYHQIVASITEGWGEVSHLSGSLHLVICWFFLLTGPYHPSLLLQVLSLMGIVNGHYCYLADHQLLESCHPTNQLSHNNQMSFLWGPSPLNLVELNLYLAGHPNQQFAAYIYQGLQYGFYVGLTHSSTYLRSSTHNHPSSTERPCVVTDHIHLESQHGRLIGPIPPSLTHMQLSPIGLVPKPHSEKFRLIMDLSSPQGHSVNDGISPTLCSLQYASVDIIRQLGRSTLLLKIDLSNAYHIVLVHPHDQILLGITWQDKVYIARALPFGLRSAPKIFNAVAHLFPGQFIMKVSLSSTTLTIFSSFGLLDFTSMRCFRGLPVIKHTVPLPFLPSWGSKWIQTHFSSAFHLRKSSA